jgi:hypothetical protein
MLSSQEHLYMGIVVQGKCWETRGQRQGGHIVFIARLWTFVGGVGRFVGGVGVRSTGSGQNRVLRDWNLFILLGFEGAKCRICWIFGKHPIKCILWRAAMLATFA